MHSAAHRNQARLKHPPAAVTSRPARKDGPRWRKRERRPVGSPIVEGGTTSACRRLRCLTASGRSSPSRSPPSSPACPDGQPVSVATCYLLDGDEVLVNMDAGRRRLAYLRADPRVSLTVPDGADWYTHVSLQGRIVRWRDDEGLVDTSTDCPTTTVVSRTRPGTGPGSAVERWHGWGHAHR
jgi:Pyridoxamine 5'-phosphate oxidase